MSTRSIIVVVLALVFGGSAAIMVRQFALNSSSGAEEVETVKVLVASESIPRGKNITKEMVVEKDMRKEDVPEGAMTVDQIEDVIGKKALATITANEPILPSKYTKQDILPISPGHKAISISTSSVEASNGGLLRPGDFVDLIFVPTDQSAGGPETIVYNQRIIAIDTNIVPESEDSTETDVEFSRITSVTLDVLPKNAEFIFYMQRRGTINLALLNSSEALANTQESLGGKYLAEFEKENSEAPEEPLIEIPEGARVQVLVASRTIREGEKITPTSFEVVHKLKADVLDESFLAHESDEIKGTFALVSLVRGEPLLKTRFSRIGSFSHLISKGMVAYKLTSSDGAFLPITPEDKLEILFTPNEREFRSRNNQNGNRSAPPATITLMKGVRVVAVNDSIDRVAAQSGSINTIVLEVHPSEASMLSFARKNGSLETTLLPLSDETDRISLSLSELNDLVNPPLPKIDKPAKVNVVNASPLIPPQPQIIKIRELRNRNLGLTTLQTLPPKTSP